MINHLVTNGRRIALLMALILIGLGCGPAEAATMPTFTLPNLADGSTVESSSLNGKVVLINFFTTW